MSSNHRQGFTLIEVLVVLVIIGILTSVIVLSVGGLGDSAVAENEAEYVYKMLKAMPEEAIIAKKEIGFNLNYGSLNFLKFDENGGWQNYESPHKLDERISVQINVEGRDIALNNSSGKPLVIFYSSGEITPFTMRLEAEGKKQKAFIIKTSGANEIVFEQEQ